MLYSSIILHCRAIFFCYFLVTSFSYAQDWQVINPTPWSNTSISPFFIDEQYGWVAGYGGNVLATTDGGETWSIYSTQSRADLYDIFFINRDTGWAVGNADGKAGIILGFPPLVYFHIYGVFEKTTDGGKTWVTVPTPLVFNTAWPEKVYHWYKQVQFIDDQHGWIMTDERYVYRTTDGGYSWTTHEVHTQPGRPFERMDFVNANLGFVTAQNGTYRTTDGGVQWAKIRDDGGDIRFLNDSTGFIAEEYLFVTTDSGSTWTVVDSSLSYCRQLFFLDSLNGWMVVSQSLYRTTDGGTIWSMIAETSVIPDDETRLVFSSEQNGWSAGWFGSIERTTDGGQSWPDIRQNLLMGVLPTIHAVHAIGENDVWVASGDPQENKPGQLLHSSDSGDTWVTQILNTNYEFSDLHFFNAQNGIAIGKAGLYLVTTNGGTNWSNRTVGQSGDFISMFFLNTSQGWLLERIGDDFRLYSSTDGGGAWNFETLVTLEGGLNGRLFKIFFTDSQNGFAVGGDLASGTGFILATQDSGNTWSTPAYPAIGVMEDLFFIDSFNGWVVGRGTQEASKEKASILHTTDGGATWDAQLTPFDEILGYEKPISLSSVVFLDKNTGWAAGSDSFLHTTNGGATWIELPSKTSRGDLHLFFVSNLYGWAAGTEGNILRYEFDPTTSVGNSSPLIEIDKLSFRIEQNYPNPFNPTTIIEYQLPHSARVRLEIFDVTGRRVKSLVETEQYPGDYRVVWDGTSDDGVPVSTGIYISRLSMNQRILSRKMLLIR